MESAAALRSFHRSAGTMSQALSSVERPSMAPWPMSTRSVAAGKLNFTATHRTSHLVSYAKISEVSVSSKSDDSSPQGSNGKHSLRSATFPNMFEALVLEVCDETSIAELKLKVGDMEMNLKRDVGASSVPMSVNTPAVAPPIPSEPMDQSVPAVKSAPKKSDDSPFAYASLMKPSKLADLEASGSTGYKLIPSPTVGSYRRGRTVKGKRQPPMCKEGDLIKEGQVIGYVDQFGTELPVKSDVAGEVVKILFDEGDAIGYGDPLIAILPSFGI